MIATGADGIGSRCERRTRGPSTEVDIITCASKSGYWPVLVSGLESFGTVAMVPNDSSPMDVVNGLVSTELTPCGLLPPIFPDGHVTTGRKVSSASEKSTSAFR